MAPCPGQPQALWEEKEEGQRPQELHSSVWGWVPWARPSWRGRAKFRLQRESLSPPSPTPVPRHTQTSCHR